MFYEIKGFEAIIWIALAIPAIVYLIYRNIHLTKITNQIEKINKETEKKAEDLLKVIRRETDKEKKYNLFTEMVDIDKKYRELTEDRKRWPQQRPRINRQISKLHSYLICAKDLLSGYGIDMEEILDKDDEKKEKSNV